MARRRKANADLSGVPAPTPDKVNEYRSGWCMTEYHEECKHVFSHGTCPCECHKPQRVQRSRKKTAPIVDNNTDDPRPWVKKG